MCNIVPQQFKTLVIEQMLDVVPSAGEEIIHAEHLAAALQELLAEMRAEKSSSARNKDAFLKMLQQNPPLAGHSTQFQVTQHILIAEWVCLATRISSPTGFYGEFFRIFNDFAVLNPTASS